MNNNSHAFVHIINDLRMKLRDANRKNERFEKIICSIANIDTLFLQSNGEDREFNETEALEEIERLVMPVWIEYCKRQHDND
ncbi:hypothetical protein PQ478_09035 [Alkalihalophilus pseudofirmus]|uniref:hypothetical protein n=1 Tax=Alkalihalophilus pseudofirmus TaxID=79885 RepID=UPI00259BE91B|nr:hypothetical protein [Alkalihalophilus pseudofirmus]WEG18615.1 hypothetical protein PQ478_09035 [Alkalihalophilus pseudofirmus]